jgi:hypothetical protein
MCLAMAFIVVGTMIEWITVADYLKSQPSMVTLRISSHAFDLPYGLVMPSNLISNRVCGAIRYSVCIQAEHLITRARSPGLANLIIES